MTISQQAAEVTEKLRTCGQGFRALRAVGNLVEQVDPRNPFGGSVDAISDLAALLEVIAERGIEDADAGYEQSQALERMGGGL